jgi:DNA-binding transcriptional ArsR family regulator
MSEFYKLFGHPARLGVVHLLAKRRNMSASELAEELGVSPVVLAQHIARLRRLRVVEGYREGKEVHYKLADPSIVQACDKFEGFYDKTFK